MATVVTEVSTLIRAFAMPRTTPVIKKNPFQSKGSRDRDAQRNKEVNRNPYDSKIPQGLPEDSGLYLSLLGTPVISDLTFVGGSYTDEETGRVINYRDVTQVTVLMQVSRPKIIVKTNITGSNGTVKEYINMDDFQVTINGIITGANGIYPVEDVADLQAVCEAPVTIPVVSTYLQNLGIYSLVINDFSFDQEPGGYSQQNFTLNCISDKPIELVLIR